MTFSYTWVLWENPRRQEVEAYLLLRITLLQLLQQEIFLHPLEVAELDRA